MVLNSSLSDFTEEVWSITDPSSPPIRSMLTQGARCLWHYSISCGTRCRRSEMNVLFLARRLTISKCNFWTKTIQLLLITLSQEIPQCSRIVKNDLEKSRPIETNSQLSWRMRSCSISSRQESWNEFQTLMKSSIWQSIRRREKCRQQGESSKNLILTSLDLKTHIWLMSSSTW